MINARKKRFKAELEKKEESCEQVGTERKMKNYWSQSEVDRWVEAVKEHGRDWKAVADAVQTRDALNCSLRYHRHVQQIKQGTLQAGSEIYTLVKSLSE